MTSNVNQGNMRPLLGTFVDGLILMKIYMNAYIMKTQFFLTYVPCFMSIYLLIYVTLIMNYLVSTGIKFDCLARRVQRCIPSLHSNSIIFNLKYNIKYLH